jgi:hypothetical protein
MNKSTQVSSEKRFWLWFTNHASEISAIQTGTEPILDQLEIALKQVHPSLTFEIGLKTNDQCELVLSANGAKIAFPAVKSLVATAPPLAGWIITAFRQPQERPYKVQYEGFELSPDEIWFSMTPDGKLISLTLYIRGLTPGNENRAAGAAFILLDHVLGEYDVETKIGAIQRLPLPNDPERQGLRPLSKLRALISSR